MHNPASKITSSVRKSGRLVAIILASTFLLTLGCDLSSLISRGNDEALRQSMVDTQTALSVQMTMSVQKAQDEAEQQQALMTQSAAAVQSTLQAVATATSETVPTEEGTINAETETQSATATSQSPVNLAGFDDWKKSAHILLYEDITGTVNVKRVVSDALETLALKFDDAKSDAGTFLIKINNQSEKNGWDLIIASMEDRRGVGGGSFYEPLHTAIENGSSVIIEMWNLDSSLGKAEELLSECNIEYQVDFNSEYPMGIAGQVLYSVDTTHPIANEPNSDLRISDVTGFWTDTYPIGTTNYDYGDKLEKPAGSKASIVFGLKVNEPNSSGVVVNCIDGRLTLMTVSTHSYSSERIRPLWENMIYQGLKARYIYLQSHP